MSSPSKHIVVSPIGEFSAELLKRVAAEIERVFGFQAQVKTLLTDVEFALDPNRSQYHSTPILGQLAGLASDHTFKVLGITRVDLFIPILTHVYGEAQLNGKACIISTYRLKHGLTLAAGLEPYFCRVAKEAIHELGHTFNLRHCRDHTCIMFYCRNEQDVDRKSDQLCRYCKVLLADEIKKTGG